MVTAWTQTVDSSTTPGTHYTIQKSVQGLFSCTCWAWRKQYTSITARTCKHLQQVLGVNHEWRRAPRSFAGLTRARPMIQVADPHTRPTRRMTFHTHEVATATFNGWLMSEKLDGIFVRWHNNTLSTSTGRALVVPEPWLSALTAITVPLDCELYAGIHGREALNVVISGGSWPRSVRVVAFDTVAENVPAASRITMLQHLLPVATEDWVRCAVYATVVSVEDLTHQVQLFGREGKEGVVLRHPTSLYTSGVRNPGVVKLKPRSTTTARALAVLQGKSGQWRIRAQEITGPGVVFFVSIRSPDVSTMRAGQVFTCTFLGRTSTGKPDFARFIPTAPFS
jgi:hypothetical protein